MQRHPLGGLLLHGELSREGWEWHSGALSPLYFTHCCFLLVRNNRNINIHFSSFISGWKQIEFLFFNLQESWRKLWDKERKSIILALTFVWMASTHHCYWHEPTTILSARLAAVGELSGVTVWRHIATFHTFFCNDLNNSYRDNLVFLLQKLNLTAAGSQKNKKMFLENFWLFDDFGWKEEL